VRRMSDQGRSETAKVNPRRPEGFPDRLRVGSLIAVLVGGGASVGLMLRAGRRNDSRILMALMAIWVASPFIALAWANLVSIRWPGPARRTLYWVMLVLTLASLAVYGMDGVRPLNAKAAFVFVVVPPASWLLGAMVVLIGRFESRRLSRGSRREH
jgi:hypothetical protein